MPRLVGWLLLVALCLPAAILGAAGAAVAHGASDRITLGVRVAGVELGGWGRRAAQAVLDRIDEELAARRIAVHDAERVWFLLGSDFGLRADWDATWAEAYRVGRQGAVLRRLLDIADAYWRGRAVDLALQVDEQKLGRFLADLAGQVHRPPRNARLNPITGGIEPEVPGRRLDVAATRERILAAWRDPQARTVELVAVPLPARTSAAALANLPEMTVRARFSTYFQTGDRNRAHNIRLGAAAIDGVLLQPGEVLSFNEVVGPRTRQLGYREAVEIVNQEFVPGVGGGICQVSSTLYNAAVLADLTVVERRNHSRPLGYVRIGRDATVYYGVIDLVLRNDLPHPVLLATEIVENRLSVAVHGPAPASRRQVRIEVTEVEEIPGRRIERASPELPPDTQRVVQQGWGGYRVSVYKVVEEDGREVSRQLLSRDVYPSRETVVLVGAATGATGEPAAAGPARAVR